MMRTVMGVLLVVLGLLVPSVARAQTEQVFYYYTDAVGSVRMITDATGQNVEWHDYQPFGEESPLNPQTPERRLYTGKERDSETNYDYSMARYYAGINGRFTTVDPGHIAGDVFNPQTWNAYAYALNNPLRYVDPYGLASDCPNGTVLTDNGCISSSELAFGQESGASGWNNSQPKEIDAVSMPGAKFITNCEGFRPGAYNDTRTNCTIGYGHLLHPGPCTAAENQLTIAEPIAMGVFVGDLRSTASELATSLSVALTQPQFDAIGSLAFNMGLPRLRSHDVWRDLNGGNLSAVPGDIRSLGGGGPGIPIRRAREANMFGQGIYPTSCYGKP